MRSKSKDVLILFGPPGSGKTTQAFFMKEKFNLYYVSWGQISREIMSSGGRYPQFQQVLNTALAEGKKLASGMVADIIESEIKRVIEDNPKIKGIVLDGFPRYLAEAKELLEIINRNNLFLKGIIGFNIFLPTVFQRVSERVYCRKCGRFYSKLLAPKVSGVCDFDGNILKKRKDDEEKLVKARFELYLEETIPTFDYLALHAETSFYVNANQSEPLIFAELVTKLSNHEKTTHKLYYKTGQTKLPTDMGDFQLIGFQNTVSYDYHLVLAFGEYKDKRRVPVRVHSSCITGDIFASQKCDCGSQLKAAMDYIQQIGQGLIIYLFQEGRGINILNKIKAYELQDSGLDTIEANEYLHLPAEMRQYEVVRDIMDELSIKSMDLITNSPDKMNKLQSLGITIESRIPLVLPFTKHNKKYLKTKEERSGHFMKTEQKTEEGGSIEVEIKFALTVSQAIAIRTMLSEMPGASFRGKRYEKTSNFDNEESRMKEDDARLRVREISRSPEDERKKIEFCYKRRLSVDGIKKEEEIESDFESDPERLMSIIKKMGYELVDGYERFRETFLLRDVKITIDEFPFGYLLEIEGRESEILELSRYLNLDPMNAYKLSCDDFYVELCRKKGVKPKPFIAFDDMEMPKYE
ncbi:nucleoside monophosphate kinase [Candidatus Uhrbacteria bacterium]|nr:nucleoside monophosphate kinase [Candidatus Uhrbacteria bacterium]